MLVYNSIHLQNYKICRKAKKWLGKGFINEAEYDNIKKQYPSPYKSFNIFARIGLYIFTVFIFSSSVGLFSLLFGNTFVHDYLGFFIFQSFLWGIVSYIAAEVAVTKYFCYNTGIETALLYLSVQSVAVALVLIIGGDTFNIENHLLLYFILLLPVILIPAIRFADIFLTLCSFICLIIVNALLILKLGTLGKMILPFECMAFSYLIYYFIVKNKNRKELKFWENNLAVIEGASLLAFYLSGNYMVVRILTQVLLGTTINPGEDISLAFLFYAFTIIIPIIYIWLGLKRKSNLFLRLGLLLEVGGILSIKYYHTILPPETAMILGGIVTIAIAYISLQYFKIPKHGITFQLYKQSTKEEVLTNVASIAASALVTERPVPAPDEVKFGGGQFGGGGAGGNY